MNTLITIFAISIVTDIATIKNIINIRANINSYNLLFAKIYKFDDLSYE